MGWVEKAEILAANESVRLVLSLSLSVDLSTENFVKR